MIVRGQITSSVAYITAIWDDQAQTAGANFTGVADAPRIVVKPPKRTSSAPPDENGTLGSRSPLKVGDTFTQEIRAVDFLSPIINDLSAWQMQITYNPEVLQFVGASEVRRILKKVLSWKAVVMMPYLWPFRRAGV